MEIIIGFLLLAFMGYFHSSSPRKESVNKSNITKIDDNNWIVNNELVSFEEDTPILRLRQELEDNKHYRHYENERLRRDREKIFNDWTKTTRAIIKYPDLKNCVTEEKLDAITQEYDKYVYVCNKLKETYAILTKEEFLIKEENVAFCVDFRNSIWLTQGLGGYMIHNEKTAKYLKGDMRELIAKEFETKWY